MWYCGAGSMVRDVSKEPLPMKQRHISESPTTPLRKPHTTTLSTAIVYETSVVDEWNIIMRWCLEGKPVPVTIRPPQKPRGNVRCRNRAYVVRGRWPTAWRMARPQTLLFPVLDLSATTWSRTAGWSIIWRWVVSFTTRLFYPRDKQPTIPMGQEAGRTPQSVYILWTREISTSHCRESKPDSWDVHLVASITIPTEQQKSWRHTTRFSHHHVPHTTSQRKFSIVLYSEFQNDFIKLRFGQ